MIKIKNLTKKYGNKKVLDNISLEVYSGEILGFLGPNGAGKTTTLKIVTGFVAPSDGQIEIDGLDMRDNSLKIRSKLGYLGENNPLYDDMKVTEFLRFVARLKKINPKKINYEIERVGKICGIENVLYQIIGELSKGYKQRVGLAQAMIGDPEILILDEPTSGLDPNQIVEIRELIKNIGKKKTVIFSTHILGEVQEVCDRIIIIHQGKIVGSGSPQELIKKFGDQNVIYVKIKGEKEKILDKLKQLDQVHAVVVKDKEQENVYGYRIVPQKGVDLRERLSGIVMENNWHILEFRKEDKNNLENVFRELTQ